MTLVRLLYLAYEYSPDTISLLYNIYARDIKHLFQKDRNTASSFQNPDILQEKKLELYSCILFSKTVSRKKNTILSRHEFEKY